MSQIRVRHIEATAKLNYLLVRRGAENDPIKLGERLVELGIDKITDGFWVWLVNTELEYFSPKFRETLGFSNEQDFPNIPVSWQNQIFKEDGERALIDYHKHLKDPNYPYYLNVRYRKKGKGVVNLICAGTIVNRESDSPIMIGTHEIISF